MELKNLTAGYTGAPVLQNVNITVPPSTVVALLGPNGAGKTTLLRTAGGLLEPREGTVTVAGKDVTADRPHRRAAAGLCLVPEGRGVFPRLTVKENLALFAPAGHKQEGIDVAVEAFPALGRRLHQDAGKMSGGEQQMLALSRCFMTNPEVVLLDEVSMGLAPLVVEQIFEALRALAATGTSLLLVEQYIGQALAFADHLYLLERGEIVFSGSPEEIDEDELAQKYLHVEASSDHTLSV
ncbi:ABC transporter ATP-binding protein [Rhodococcus wratislaviensis]|nr:ABC transporter ATP-binding protein [Rhodococcus sp. 3A]MBC2894792.1 ABC transporter ATP-binding protein [Rhodococcus sp. 4CII]